MLVTEFNEKYHEMNNNVTEFLNDYSKDYFLGKRAPEVYGEYEIWCEEIGLRPLSPKQLQESMLKIHNLEIRKTTVNKRSTRAFMEVK